MSRLPGSFKATHREMRNEDPPPDVPVDHAASTGECEEIEWAYVYADIRKALPGNRQGLQFWKFSKSQCKAMERDYPNYKERY